MKPAKNSAYTEDISEEIQQNNTLSIDEFFKQLEAKEKDLDISAEMVIEVEESDVEETAIPHFILAESQPNEQKENEAEAFDKRANEENSVAKLKNKVSMLQKQVSKLESERVELFEISRRRQIDFEGYKKRTERERNETFLNQVSGLAVQLLPVLDNFNRALESASNLTGEKVLDSQHFYNGIVLVNQQLNEVLSEMGVLPINSVGETFDPHFHEAVATEETDDIPPHTITAELLRGYSIGDRVIRPSMVKVSKSRESKAEQ